MEVHALAYWSARLSEIDAGEDNAEIGHFGNEVRYKHQKDQEPGFECTLA